MKKKSTIENGLPWHNGIERKAKSEWKRGIGWMIFWKRWFLVMSCRVMQWMVYYDEKRKTKKFQGRNVDFFERNVEMMEMFWPWAFFYVAKENLIFV